MSVPVVLSAALLAVGVLAVLLSCVGVLLIPDAYDKLHYAAPANTIGPVALALAIVVRAGFGPAGVKALVVAAVLVSTNSALTHATARAAYVRTQGEWRIDPVGPGPKGGRDGRSADEVAGQIAEEEPE
jgi:multicomponent Na+:H+ antiporter subunit G